MRRRHRLRGFLLFAAGILGIVGFLRDNLGRADISTHDWILAVISAGLLAAGIVVLVRANAS